MAAPKKAKQLPTMDDLAKGFLGTGDPKELIVKRNQKANADKQKALYEQQLTLEACDYGDALVNYVSAHGDLDIGQRVFAVTLALINLRRDFPDGGEKYDAYVDLAGDDLKIITIPAVNDDTWRTLTPESQLAAAKFAETLAAYITMTKQRAGLSNPQAAYGLGRMFHTLRAGFPPAEGGPPQFDVYAKLAGEYYAKYASEATTSRKS